MRRNFYGRTQEKQPNCSQGASYHLREFKSLMRFANHLSSCSKLRYPITKILNSILLCLQILEDVRGYFSGLISDFRFGFFVPIIVEGFLFINILKLSEVYFFEKMKGKIFFFKLMVFLLQKMFPVSLSSRLQF